MEITRLNHARPSNKYLEGQASVKSEQAAFLLLNRAIMSLRTEEERPLGSGGDFPADLPRSGEKAFRSTSKGPQGRCVYNLLRPFELVQ